MVKFIPEIRGIVLTEKTGNPLTFFCREVFNSHLTEGVSAEEIERGFFRIVLVKSCVHVDNFIKIDKETYLFLFDPHEWEIVLQLNSEK